MQASQTLHYSVQKRLTEKMLVLSEHIEKLLTAALNVPS